MATSVPGTSPLSHALQSIGVQRPAAQPKVDPKTAIDDLSRQTGAPANVLLALAEAGGDLDGVRRSADFLGKRLSGGTKLQDAVSELAGDPKRGAALLDRSYAIADELYPEPAKPEEKPGIGTDLKDLGKLGAAGAVNMTGGALQALGAFADDAMRASARAELEASGGDPSQVQGESIVRSGSRAAADAVRGAGGAVAGSVSDRMKQAMEGTQFKGELFSPSTWSAGDDPSIRGVLAHTAQGLGSMIPVAAASAVAGPAGAAVMGGLGAAGEGAQAGRDFVTAAQGREGESGPAAIEAMPGYRVLREQGMSHHDAVAELARLTESESAAWQAIPGTVGGAATGKILSRAEGLLNSGGRAARVLKKGAAGALEEGAQEAVEGMASQQGIAAATGAEVNTQQDSFGNFVLGALSGGAMGAGAGLISPGETEREQSGSDVAPDAVSNTGAPTVEPGEGGPLALPAQASGGTIFGASEARQDPGSFERDPSNPNRPAADQSGAGAQFRPGEPPPMASGNPDPAAEAERIFRDQPDTLDLPGDMPVPTEIDGDFREVPQISDTGPDGSGAGTVAAPGIGDPSLSAVPGAAATNPALPAPRRAGPVEQMAQSIVAATPAPLPEAPIRFPDQKPGSEVRFGDPASGQIIDGVFLGETPDGVKVRLAGREIDLTPEQFDAGRDAVVQIEEARKRAEQEAKQAAKALPAPKPEVPNDAEPSDAAEARDPALLADPATSGPDDGQPGSGAPTAPGRAADQAGREAFPPMAEAGLPAAQGGMSSGLDQFGDVDVGDDAGELRGSLTDPAGGVDVSEPPVREQQTGLSPADAHQSPEAWPWRGKKINAKTRHKAMADYLTPGNIIEGYGGERQRVVAFDPKANSITIEPVELRGDEWAGTGERRVHGTWPADRELQRGPLARAASPIDAAAAEAHTDPTDAQKEAGNYRKGHARWNGLDLSIENAKGSERRGTGPDGTEWSVTMPAHYGYFRGTEASDGDHVDFYMGDNPDAPNAYVIDQKDAETGAYDEAKVMLGFDSAAAARAAHEAAFSDGTGTARLGGIKKMPVADLKAWLASDGTKRPVSMRARRAATEKPAPAPQKRPLMSYVAQRLGGINPTGKVAEELRHRGVTSRTAPGLWRRTGRKELDNIPAGDHPDLEALVGRSDDGLYLDPAKIIEAMVEEVSGRPQPLGEQAVLQQQARATEEAADHARQKEAVYEIVPPGDDPRPAAERRSAVEGAVDDFLEKFAPGALTESEREDTIAILIRYGGDIDVAVEDAIIRSQIRDERQEPSGESADIPFGDDRDGERFDQKRTDEEGSEPALGDSGRMRAGAAGTDGEGQRDGLTPDAGEKHQRDPQQASSDTASVPTSALRGLAKSLRAELVAHGLDLAISPKIVREILTARGVPVHGSYRAGEIRITAGARDATHTARHEIIHALRDPALWGRRHGLFTADEWRALVKAARGNRAIRGAVEAAYADLSTPAQTEEMVAEMYADWARGRDADPPGPVRAALERIASFFRAMAAALRGEGFSDAALVMERVASGEIGGRGPDGDGNGTTTTAPKIDKGGVRILDEGRRRGAREDQGDNRSEKQQHDLNGSGDDIQTVIDAARAPGHAPQKADIGTAADWVIAAAAEAGIDLASLRHIIDGSAVRHILGQHGNEKKEARRGQSAVTDADLLSLDQVIGAPDAVAFGSTTRIGWPAVIYAKIMPDNTIVMVEELRNKRGEAAVNTMWKMASAAKDAYALKRILLSNVRNDSGADIKVVLRDDFVKEQRDLSALKAQLSRSGARAKGMIGNLHWKNAPSFFSSLLTDAMGKNDTMNILSLVPGNPLFEELGKGLSAAQKYLREKQEMDAWRNDWQARAAAVVDGWTREARKNPEANDRLMDLMHASTLAGVDPSREGSWRRPVDDEARRALKQPDLSPERQKWAQGVIRAANDRERTWQRLKADFDALPAEFRDLYQQIRDEYGAMADEQDAALMQNIRTASKIAVKRADREHQKELNRIRDEGLTGEARAEALAKANKRKTDAHARAARGGGARLQQLRQMFEANRLEGPYFPLARFGNYFVTIRDDGGKVTSFSRFQTEREQRAWVNAATERGLGKVEHGVLGGDANLKGKVDPTFVAEVESLLADAGASDEMMDAVWQRWLETLPDQSVRTNRIHRKGRLGFNKDATRAFSSAMFHGAHQTARLRHGLEMEDALDDAEDQAKLQPNPNRAGFVVREMRQRHAFTMSPTNNPLVSAASGLAFVWYLGMSPASAIVNLSQTTIVGVPVMAARFRRAGISGTSAELARALRDFGAGRGWSEKSDRLSADEKAAMKAGYDRGVIDKTQSHDLAAVAESGVEYNPVREKVMRIIGWGFHHTERLNREVTFLAAYRMARAEGMGQPEAVDEASRQVWKVHFDYQNTSRPRVMQSDMGKILTTFRNFSVNMLYRLFRDAHQSFAGADAETRREARAQLIGISLSMFAHAGIKGVWGFGLLSMLLGAFLPGDDDDFENWLQDAMLIEGDGPGVAAWNWTMGMALNGVPGTVLDTDLTGRIGMADLWFRGSQKDLEGKDLWAYYVEQVAGPVVGIGGSVATGLSMLADGEWQRGAEKVVPKFAGSLIKSARYIEDGVTTYHGDPILDRVNPYEALNTALGFTPARVSERYRANTWLKNQERKIEGQRKSLMSDIGQSIRSGDGVTPALAQQVAEWNVKYPFYPITAKGLRQSIASRQRMSRQTQGGVNLNPKLDQHLREQVAPAVR